MANPPPGVKGNAAVAPMPGQHVRAIESDPEGITVTTQGGLNCRAKVCICTFPSSALRHIQVAPRLEGAQAEAVRNLGYAPVCPSPGVHPGSGCISREGIRRS